VVFSFYFSNKDTASRLNSLLNVALGFLAILALLWGNSAPFKECASNRGRIRVSPSIPAIPHRFKITLIKCNYSANPVTVQICAEQGEKCAFIRINDHFLTPLCTNLSVS